MLIRGDIINKKIVLVLVLVLFVVLALILLMPITSSLDFEGHFTMNVPIGQKYWNVAWCHPNGALGCAKEYWECDAGCEINEGEFVIYYYNDSLLDSGDSNTLQHAVNVLTSTYLYKFDGSDGKFVILTNDLGMRNVPHYMVGISNDDKSKAVFVGGYNLDDLKRYADSVEFE